MNNNEVNNNLIERLNNNEENLEKNKIIEDSIERDENYFVKNKEIEKNRCAICNRDYESGLFENNIDGIIINGEYICRKCEKEIIETDIEENKYDDYVEKIKVIIYK